MRPALSLRPVGGSGRSQKLLKHGGDDPPRNLQIGHENGGFLKNGRFLSEKPLKMKIGQKTGVFAKLGRFFKNPLKLRKIGQIRGSPADFKFATPNLGVRWF